MAERTIIGATRFLKECLQTNGVNVSKIILFGSQSRDEATADSDIDVAIVSEDFRGKDIFQRVELIRDAEVAAIKKFVVPFDIVTLTPEELESQSSLIGQYARNGEVV